MSLPLKKLRRHPKVARLKSHPLLAMPRLQRLRLRKHNLKNKLLKNSLLKQRKPHPRERERCEQSTHNKDRCFPKSFNCTYLYHSHLFKSQCLGVLGFWGFGV